MLIHSVLFDSTVTYLQNPVIMSFYFWRLLSGINSSLLPKIYRKPDLMKLTSLDKAVLGWKMFVTYKYLDSAKSKGHNVV